MNATHSQTKAAIAARKYRAEHPGYNAAACAKWQKENPAACVARVRRWQLANWERYRAQQSRYKAARQARKGVSAQMTFASVLKRPSGQMARSKG